MANDRNGSYRFFFSSPDVPSPYQLLVDSPVCVLLVTSADVLDASPDKPDVGKWTPEDVTTWLADSGLDK